MTTTPIYLFLNGEMMIDAPLEKVWPHVIDYASWQNYSIVQHVSGRAGQEGEVVLLKKEEKGSGAAPYHARTLKLEPQRRIVWKTFQDPKTEGSGGFGIVEFTVHDAQGKTRFCYNTVYEIQAPQQTEAELIAFRDQQYKNFEMVLSAIFPKLKKLAEKGV